MQLVPTTMSLITYQAKLVNIFVTTNRTAVDLQATTCSGRVLCLILQEMQTWSIVQLARHTSNDAP